jgi:RND family efflux transporter MFP subunit
MSFMKIQFNTSVLLILFITGILIASCSGDSQEATINKGESVTVMVAVARAEASSIIQTSGQIESKETAIISTRIMGFITDVKVKAGDKVQKGQLLATISNSDILAKRDQAKAMVSETEAALKDAQKDYERFAELYKQNSAATKEFENATLHLNSIKAKAETAKQLQNEAEAMLTYTNLTAPFSGVIIQKDVDAGSMANPGVPLLIIEQTGAYQVSATVSESEITNVKEGAKATIILKSTGRIMQGSVSEVSPSSQFSGGQYRIKVNIPESEKAGLYSGMYVNVAIEASGKITSNNLLVPTTAILYKDQLTGLYTITENQTALLRWVTLGKTYGDQVEILSGLRNDENFILTSKGKLYNGVPITLE